MVVLEVKNVSKRINEKQILADVNFSVQKGEILAIVGPNGAGKTTTLKCIINAASRDTGEVLIFGKPFEPSLKKNIAFVSEHRRVFPKLTLDDYHKMYQVLYPNWDEIFFKNFLSRYGFSLNQELSKFSMGQRTLILVILALATNAELVLLDEPTQNLDPTVRFEVIQLIKQYVQEKNNAIIVSSHEIFELEEYATNIAIIKNGRILYCDSIDDAKQKHRIVSSITNLEDAEVIGLLDGEVLVKTEKEVGEYPRLNQIIIGYLRGKEGMQDIKGDSFNVADFDSV